MADPAPQTAAEAFALIQSWAYQDQDTTPLDQAAIWVTYRETIYNLAGYWADRLKREEKLAQQWSWA